MQPQLPIEVDAQTGVWQTDGLPMLYVPRHFFVNNHAAVEEALGRDVYAELLYNSGHKSAYQWCASESVAHGITGMAVFEHYLSRLSLRGWGRFTIQSADARTSTATIVLQHSAFVLAQPDRVGRLCYMFQGWFAGAMDWVNDSAPDPDEKGPSSRAFEIECCGEGHDRCLFEVQPRFE